MAYNFALQAFIDQVNGKQLFSLDFDNHVNVMELHYLGLFDQVKQDGSSLTLSPIRDKCNKKCMST